MQSENPHHVEEQNYVEEEPNLISQQFEGLLTSLSKKDFVNTDRRNIS